MNFLTANIACENIELLDEASNKSGVSYIRGISLTHRVNQKPRFSFHPIFCESEEMGEKLLHEYHAIAREKNIEKALSKDNFVIKPYIIPFD